jgi:putative flippase GtrA
MASVIGMLFIAFRKALVRFDQEHRRWVWRVNTTERSAKVTETMMVVIGLAFVGIGVLTLATS